MITFIYDFIKNYYFIKRKYRLNLWFNLFFLSFGFILYIKYGSFLPLVAYLEGNSPILSIIHLPFIESLLESIATIFNFKFTCDLQKFLLFVFIFFSFSTAILMLWIDPLVALAFFTFIGKYVYLAIDNYSKGKELLLKVPFFDISIFRKWDSETINNFIKEVIKELKRPELLDAIDFDSLTLFLINNDFLKKIDIYRAIKEWIELFHPTSIIPLTMDSDSQTVNSNSSEFIAVINKIFDIILENPSLVLLSISLVIGIYSYFKSLKNPNDNSGNTSSTGFSPDDGVDPSATATPIELDPIFDVDSNLIPLPILLPYAVPGHRDTLESEGEDPTSHLFIYTPVPTIKKQLDFDASDFPAYRWGPVRKPDINTLHADDVERLMTVTRQYYEEHQARKAAGIDLSQDPIFIKEQEEKTQLLSRLGITSDPDISEILKDFKKDEVKKDEEVKEDANDSN